MDAAKQYLERRAEDNGAELDHSSLYRTWVQKEEKEDVTVVLTEQVGLNDFL